MSINRLKSQHWRAWLVAWVMLLGALAPSVSHWLQASSKAPVWSEICSSRGHKAPVKSTLVKADSHCASCLPHAPHLGLPPSADLTLPTLGLAHAEPWLFLQAPHPVFVWGSSQARAPPSTPRA